MFNVLVTNQELIFCSKQKISGYTHNIGGGFKLLALMFNTADFNGLFMLEMWKLISNNIEV